MSGSPFDGMSGDFSGNDDSGGGDRAGRRICRGGLGSSCSGGGSIVTNTGGSGSSSDVVGSPVLDALFRRCAFEHFQHKVAELGCEDESAVFYSIGPCVGHASGSRLFWDALSAQTNPEPLAQTNGLGFDIRPEYPGDRGPVPTQRQGGGDVWEGLNSCGLFMFEIVRDKPNFVVPHLAPKILDAQSKMLIAELEVSEVDRLGKCLRVGFGTVDGAVASDLFVLSPDTLSVNEWLTLRSWRARPGMVYDIGVPVVHESRKLLQDVLSSLFRHHRHGDGALTDEYIVLEGDPAQAQQLGLLCLLEDGCLHGAMGGLSA